MTSPAVRRPAKYGWVAAIYHSAAAEVPLGAAVLVDERRLLTCAHVVDGRWRRGGRLWAEFPKAVGTPRRAVGDVQFSAAMYDLALLELEDAAPADVAPAPLRFPPPDALSGTDWWAFGFPDEDQRGESAHGLIDTGLGRGYVRLETESRNRLRTGFSGGGVWSARLNAVVAIMARASGAGDGQAITLHQAELCFPDARLTAIGKSPWGWALHEDPQHALHWSPRARGVTAGDDHVHRFRGRRAALTEITGWLDRDQRDHRALIVTGSPGVGKSAVLSRIVTTADQDDRAALPADDNAVRATEGSVTCAVHAKGKTALEVAAEIAQAAVAEPPEQLHNLAPAIRKALTEQPGWRANFNIVIDAVDEATNPQEAKKIVRQVVVPLLQQCAGAGVQVLAGSRRRIGEVDLLYQFADAAAVIDLDAPRYFELEDLEDYALATLQLRGAERPGNPYADVRVARPAARRIAEMSGRNFLVAGLTALTRGHYDTAPVHPRALTFTGDVASALRDYLDLVPGLPGVSAGQLLTALAFAEAPGLPLDLWRIAVEALFGAAPAAKPLLAFARQSGANFLIEWSGQDAKAAFRLFHEALDDSLRSDRAQSFPAAEDERELTEAFLSHGRATGWQHAPPYLLRSLGGHAEQAGMIDELLADDEYLLHADLARLTASSQAATTQAGRDRSLLLSRTPYATTADPATRRALFSVTESLEKLGDRFRSSGGPAPYRARWASTTTYRERVAQQGHSGGVMSVLGVSVDGNTLMASAGEDEVVRLWDPATGTQMRALQGHAGIINVMTSYATHDGRVRLVSAGADAVIRIWDPATGAQTQALEGHAGPIYALAAYTGEDGRTRLLSGGADAVVRVWEPETTDNHRSLIGHRGTIRGLCFPTIAGRRFLVSAAADGLRLWDLDSGREHLEIADAAEQLWWVVSFTAADGTARVAGAGNDKVTIWDPATGQRTRVLTGHVGPVWIVSAFTGADGRAALATACDDETARVWDAETGRELLDPVDMPGGAYCVCAFTLNGCTRLAAAGATVVRAWDAVSGEHGPALKHAQSASAALNSFTDAAGRVLLAAGAGEAVQVWDPATGRRVNELRNDEGGPARDVCGYSDGRALLATVGDDGVLRIWNPAENRCVAALEGADSPLWSVAAAGMETGQTLLSAGGRDGVITVWDAATGVVQRRLTGHTSIVWRMCTLVVDGRTLLASAGNDGMLLVWDLATGARLWSFDAHPGGTWIVCAITLADGRSLLASGGGDAMVRLWDPKTGTQVKALAGHGSGVWGVCSLRPARGPALLVSAGDDADVRVWDPASGDLLAVIPVHLLPMSVTAAGGLLAVGTAAGLLVLELSEQAGI